jgi:hypothetical protein
MKRVWNVASLALLFVALFFTSCDEEEEALSSVGDAYVIKKIVDDEVVYGTAYYLYANKSLSNVTVTTTDGEEINLSVYAGSSYTFYMDPEEIDFSTDTPIEDDFVFAVVASSGETMSVNETLEFEDLGIPEITVDSYDSDQESHTINWEPVEESDGYVVSVFTSEGDVIFESPGINPDLEEFEISSALGSWQENPIDGTTYKIQVQAFSYESSATTDGFYSFKEVSIGEKDIVWGE